MAGKGDGFLDVSEQQLGQWRDFMEQVYVGTREIQASLTGGDTEKPTIILEYLAALALGGKAQMEKFGAVPSSSQSLPFDRLHDTEANQRYLAALKQALHAASDVDAERSEEDAHASEVIQMLIADVEREIFGLPPGYDDASLFTDADMG